MTGDHIERPWEELERLADVGDSATLSSYVNSLRASDAARAMAHLSRDTQALVLQVLEPEDAASLLEDLPDAHAAEAVASLSSSEAAAILDELSSADGADLIGELEEGQAEAVLDAMSPAEAKDVRRLTGYEWDTAGGLMSTEFVTYEAASTVGEVVNDLREHAENYADYNVQYAYVTSLNVLVGVLRLRDLLIARASTHLREIMIQAPLRVKSSGTLGELADLFDRHSFVALPVVDEAGRLVGVVTRSEVEEAVGEKAGELHLKSHGIVGGEELRSMSLWTRSRRRLSWLSVNIVLNVVAASVIALHQDTLAAVISLSVFLPIISDMSGCSGNQAVAVSLRELTLGVLRPTELFHVWLKEVSVGLINGTVLGLLLGLVALLWRGNVYLGLVVGSALALNTIVAVSVGGLVPLLLRRFGMDPALASGPVLTTITDLCGFLLVLTFAAATLARLT